MTATEPFPVRPDAPARVTSPPRRFAGLDGLRGYGMLLVLFAHVSIYGGLGDSGLDGATSKVLLRGGYAVVMFFVLSGFLITGGLLEAKERSHYFRNFYARRALRIFPIYLVVVAIGLVIVPAMFDVGVEYRAQAGEQAWYWLYATNIGIAVKGWEAFQYFGHFWTLAVEEQYYLLWPVVVYALSRRRLVQVCTSLLAISLLVRLALLLWVSEAASDVLLPANMDSLSLGALIAIRLRDGDRLPAARLLGWVAVACLGGFAALTATAMALPVLGKPLWALLPTVTMVGAAGLLLNTASAAPGSRLYRIANWRPAVYLGTISYGMYVVHQPLIFLLVRAIGFDAQDVPGIGAWHLPGLVIVAAIVALATTVVATASWHLLERPILRLKRHF